ncbi:MAG TPA: HAD-IIB family hydrolase [Bradyrhizobium sp.]|uniref:HAD family hydrolase n=1 Tax=Bradyrhizobium sp. TaxID=376 RepID=UPI002C28751D|nr:HAD-IIB family hydrolase [Bradyrhizobium sp.]HLZ02880.1 HAD-IIB family hydrolase [Bradyrhizobium sp.]
MRHLAEAPPSTFAGIRFVLTDMDETLTYKGRLSGRTYDALERLQAAGIRVIPVTAAPAGWCDQMARMWPIDGVIGENGGLFFRRDGEHGVMRRYWHGEADGPDIRDRLDEIGRQIRARVPSARLADDQLFRLTSIAFARTADADAVEAIVAALRAAGARVAINNLWILGWLGNYDKLAMTRRVMAENYGIDIDADRDAILYCGDSTNDAPMFAFFHHSIGMSTVRNCLAEIPTSPAWITEGPGGDGFVEAANAVLAVRGFERRSS